MPKNPYAPDEDPKTIFLERTFVAGDFINGVGYGAQLVLYVICALFLREKRKCQSQSRLLFAYITLLLVVETIYQIVQARTVQLIYIDNRNYPGGPWAYFLATQNSAVDVIFLASYFSVSLLSDLLVFWRCWIIWLALSTRKTVFIALFFPAVLLLASLVMGILWTLQSSQPGLSLYSALPLAYGTSYYALSLSTNVILTILIAARLLVYRRSVSKVLSSDHARFYTSLATIVVESASLYSIFAVLFLITYAIENPLNQAFLSFANSAQQIANYLIIYRFAQGYAWQRETVSKVSGVHMSFAIAVPRSQDDSHICESADNVDSQDDPGLYRLRGKNEIGSVDSTGSRNGLKLDLHMYKNSKICVSEPPSPPRVYSFHSNSSIIP